MKLIILVILITNLTFAQNSAIVKKGDTVPFSGILLTEERAEEAVKAEKKVVTLEQLAEAQKALTEFHKDEASVARRRLSEAKFDSYLNVLGAFLVGTLVTSLAFKINQEVNR